MKRAKTYLLCATLLCATVFAGCGGGGSPQPGFKAQGEKYVSIAGGGFMFVSATSIRGNWQFDNGSAVGNTTSFGPILSFGPFPVDGGRVPASWNIVAGIPQAECIGYLEPTQRNVTSGSTQKSRCVTFGIIIPFASAPASVDLQAPPPTMDMTGSDLNTAYGMPYIEYVDQFSGNVLGSATATAVSADGTWLQAPVPDLSSVYSGTYNILISNYLADGSREYVGTSTIDCYGRDIVYDPPPDPDPCGCWPDQPCMPCEIQY
ncbi:MAG TPA: hypothetical protein VF240_05015 [Pyrinomonadaceae bacterium]